MSVSILFFIIFKCNLGCQCCIYRIQHSSYMRHAGRAVEGAEIGILMARREHVPSRAVKSPGDEHILSQYAVVRKAKA